MANLELGWETIYYGGVVQSGQMMKGHEKMLNDRGRGKSLWEGRDRILTLTVAVTEDAEGPNGSGSDVTAFLGLGALGAWRFTEGLIFSCSSQKKMRGVERWGKFSPGAHNNHNKQTGGTITHLIPGGHLVLLQIVRQGSWYKVSELAVNPYNQGINTHPDGDRDLFWREAGK